MLIDATAEAVQYTIVHIEGTKANQDPVLPQLYPLETYSSRVPGGQF